jgi:D-sedoheptulose 7-phosphate isomerase
MIEELAREYVTEETRILGHLPLEAVRQVVEVLQDAYAHERQIFVMGNGGSAATASHVACDINKGLGLGRDTRFRMICLNDNIPTMLAYANDVSYSDVFVEQLQNFVRSHDVVIGISGSGNSENVIKAVKLANARGAVSIGMTGFDGGRLARAARVSIVVPSRDMQMIEDMHLILCHMLFRLLAKTLPSPEGDDSDVSPAAPTLVGMRRISYDRGLLSPHTEEVG